MSRLAAAPRLLAIMGSGETAPTMVKVHRELLSKMGPLPVPAVLLDTPFGFQENAEEIAGRAVTYFRESLQTSIAVTGLATAPEPASGTVADDGSERDVYADERLVNMVRNARYVFAGPGSPSYALRKWRETVIADLLLEKLLHGGCVVFASAAALTLGIATVPVYEIYKCGQDPHWLEGLDVASAAGLRAAIIPHYDNNEGGTHDTRFCYLGERRLSKMERDLPEGAFVLGVDEHTACIFDLEAGTASVQGRGVLTVRAAGRSLTFASGETVPIVRLTEAAAALELDPGDRAGKDAPGKALAVDDVPGPGLGIRHSTSPLVDVVREHEADFASAVTSRDMTHAVGAVLDLESDLNQWSTDIPGGDELDRARASLRSLILELGHLSETGARDPRDVVGPYVETLLELREAARKDRRFDEADLVRKRLVECGIEVRDTPEGSEWVLASPAGGRAGGGA